jgi:hypothetical protein
LSIINDVEMNMRVQTFIQGVDFISFGFALRKGMVGSYSNIFLTFEVPLYYFM